MPESEPTTRGKFKSLIERFSKYDSPAVYFDDATWPKSPDEARALILARDERLKKRVGILYELFPDVSKSAKLYNFLEMSVLRESDSEKRTNFRRTMSHIQMRYTDSEEGPVFQIALEDFRALERESF